MRSSPKATRLKDLRRLTAEGHGLFIIKRAQSGLVEVDLNNEWVLTEDGRGTTLHTRVRDSLRQYRVSVMVPVAMVPAALVPGSSGYKELRTAESCKLLDSLISKLGPNWAGPTLPLSPPNTIGGSGEAEEASGEEREADKAGRFAPKGTAEAHEAGENPSEDAETHGGDGNSGECDHAAQTAAAGREMPKGGEDCRLNESSTSQSGLDTEQDSNREPSDHNPGAAENGADESSEGDEKTEANPQGEPASHDDGNSVPDRSGKAVEVDGDLDSEDKQAKVSAVAGSSSETDAAKPTDATSEDEAGGNVTAQLSEEEKRDLDGSEILEKPDHGPGGWFHSEERAKYQSKKLNWSGRRLARAIRRLIRDFDLGCGDPSPRISGQKLIREIVSKRYSMPRVRRIESDKPLILMLCDCSGSCAAVCDDTLAACFAVESAVENVVTIVHSNGLLCRQNVRGGRGVSEYKTLVEAIKEDYPGRKIGMVVAFGDWDAGQEYQAMCESGAQLIWLDSYLCAKAQPGRAGRALREPAKAWTKQPFAWFQAINTAESAADMLESI